MAVQLESAARLATLRDKADAVTGESSATLAGAVDALIAGFGAGGGGGSMESGEMTNTGENYYNFSLPVSSKKSKVLLVPKDLISALVSPEFESRCVLWYASDGEGVIQVAPGKGANVSDESNVHYGLTQGTAYNYAHYNGIIGGSAGSAKFLDNIIEVKTGYTNFQKITFLWFAW